MKIDENETRKNQKRSNKLISHCFPSLDFQNRKLKSKRNQNLIKNIIFMSSQLNLTSYFLRIGTKIEQGRTEKPGQHVQTSSIYDKLSRSVVRLNKWTNGPSFWELISWQRPVPEGPPPVQPIISVRLSVDWISPWRSRFELKYRSMRPIQSDNHCIRYTVRSSGWQTADVSVETCCERVYFW